jgi:hypothetical protein
MALYKYSQDVAVSSDAAFDQDYGPGASVPHSGIYKCRGCQRECACNGGDPLPPQNHHQHNTTQGDIRWRLAVYAQGQPQ